MGSFFRGRASAAGGRHSFVWRGSGTRVAAEWVRFFEAARVPPEGGIASFGAAREREWRRNGFVFSRLLERRRRAAWLRLARLGNESGAEWVRFFEAARAPPERGM